MEKKQLPYDYICLRCGRKLVPEGSTDDESAPVLFDLTEALALSQDSLRSFPVYFTAEELRRIVENPDSDGSSFMKIELGFADFIGVISTRLSVPALKELTPERMSSYLKSRMSAEAGMENNADSGQAINDAERCRIESLIERCYIGGSDSVGGLGSGRIDEFCAKVMSLFFDDKCDPIPYRFRIKVNLSAMGRPGTTVGYTYRIGEGEEQFPSIPVICGEPGCWKNRRGEAGSPVPPMAWQNEHIAIGFIGAAGSGKTCLITALLSKLLDTSKLVDGDKRDEVGACLDAYESNRELPKTELEGRNSFNATVLCGDKIVTLVDISGECFDLNTGKFYRNVASNHFRMIRICKCYVLCLDPKNQIYSGRGIAAQSVGDFVEYLQTGKTGYAAPILLTMTKSDCDEPDFENYDIDNIESEEDAEKRFALFLERSDKIVRENYPSFYNNIRERAYTASAVSSSYGGTPMPDDRNLPTLAKLRETSRSLCIYLTEDGRYYVSPDDDRDDYLVPRNITGRFYAVRQTDSGRRYIFDPDSRENGDEIRKLSELRLLPNDRTSRGSGVIYESGEYTASPEPRNVGAILEWLMRVCGVRKIRYSVFDERRDRSSIEEYRLRPQDRWSREDAKTTQPKLAACACALFSNPTELDRWTDEYSDNGGSRMVMRLFEKVGFDYGVNKMLGTVKRKGQS